MTTPKGRAVGSGFAEQAAAPHTKTALPRAAPTVTLSPDHQRWTDQAVADGRFDSADDAIDFALTHVLPFEPDESDDWMIPLIEEARADVRQGKFITGDEMRAELNGIIEKLESK